MESTSLTIQVDDKSFLPTLRRLIKQLDGVHIVPPKRKRKSGIELGLEDVAAGRVTEWHGTVDEMFEHILNGD